MADTTDFSIKCEILSDVWLDYRDEEGFKELFNFADLGFPLAYLIDNSIVEATEPAMGLIDETFAILLNSLNVKDTGFENINHLLSVANKNNEID